MKAKNNFKNDTVRKEFKSTLIIALVAVLLFGGIAAIRGIIYASEKSGNTTIVVPPQNDEKEENKPNNDNNKPNTNPNEEDKPQDDKNVDNVKEETLANPYKVAAKTVRYYFEVDDSIEKQQNSVYYYDGTYKPNKGMDFSYNDEKFDVNASFSGVVTDIVADSLLGWVVYVENEDGLKAVYASLSEVSVKENQEIKQGDVLGKAGVNEVSKDLGNHLHFALEDKNGNILNPEKFFGKNLSEIKK